MIGIAVANMVRAIRTISVERGHDPRDFALMPFGGAGPLHARDVATSLGISEMIIPFAPGIVCAQGLVVSDLKEDFVASQRVDLDDGAVAALRDQAGALIAAAEQWFADEAISSDQRALELNLDVRYVGQNYELSVPVASADTFDPENLPSAAELRRRFLKVHESGLWLCRQ